MRKLPRSRSLNRANFPQMGISKIVVAANESRVPGLTTPTRSRPLACFLGGRLLTLRWYLGEVRDHRRDPSVFDVARNVGIQIPVGVGVGGQTDPPTRQLLVLSVMCPFVGQLPGVQSAMGRGDRRFTSSRTRKEIDRPSATVPRPDEAIPVSRLLDTKLQELSTRNWSPCQGAWATVSSNTPVTRSLSDPGPRKVWFLGHLCQGSAMDTVDATVHSTSSWSLHLRGGGGGGGGPLPTTRHQGHHHLERHFGHEDNTTAGVIMWQQGKRCALVLYTGPLACRRVASRRASKRLSAGHVVRRARQPPTNQSGGEPHCRDPTPRSNSRHSSTAAQRREGESALANASFDDSNNTSSRR